MINTNLQEKFSEFVKDINEAAKENFLKDGELIEVFMFLHDNGETEAVPINALREIAQTHNQKFTKDMAAFLIKSYVQSHPSVYGVVHVAEIWLHEGKKDNELEQKLKEESVQVSDLPDKKEAVFVSGNSRDSWGCMYTTQILRYKNGSNDLLESTEINTSKGGGVGGRFANYWK
jgi:lipopolysaccharide biosynthesis regulator YciM